MDWQHTSQQAQQSVLDSIPAKWKLPGSLAQGQNTNRSRTIEDAGLLDPKQLEITSLDVSTLAVKIASKTLSSSEVIEAFCARAAYAHQLVRILDACSLCVADRSRQTALSPSFPKKRFSKREPWIRSLRGLAKLLVRCMEYR